MWIGSYDLHLYCDDFDLDPVVCPMRAEHPRHFEITGRYDVSSPHAAFGHDCETGAQARRKARQAGWFVKTGDSRAYCPTCALRRGL